MQTSIILLNHIKREQLTIEYQLYFLLPIEYLYYYHYYYCIIIVIIIFFKVTSIS